MSGYEREAFDNRDRQGGDYEGRGGRRDDGYGYEGGNQQSYNTQGRNHRGEAQSYYDNQEGYEQDGGYGGRQNDDRQHEGYAGGNASYGGSYGGGGGYGVEEDLSGAAKHAQEHAGSDGDASIFSSVLSAISQNKHHIQQQPVDEQSAVQSHQQFFGGGGNDQSASSGSMGAAAAMQALKMFTGGQSGSSYSGNSQNAFIGMAMAQATKLFEQQSSQGNVASGTSKESAIQEAGEMALKMYMQSQGKSGGSPGLMGLASKFL
ncbi:hypothetical protein B0O99DRAFT_572613 [Bisporella sp. PMI_857]|nr:hypothetical protein B0O99DRAFT_572613 [Bisporella sp. PMI_857]